MNKPGEVLREKLRDILIGVELYGKCPIGNWGTPVDYALVTIMGAVKSCVPDRDRPHTMASENSDEYLIYSHGWNKCREVLLDNMGVGDENQRA